MKKKHHLTFEASSKKRRLAFCFSLRDLLRQQMFRFSLYITEQGKEKWKEMAEGGERGYRKAAHTPPTNIQGC